MLKNNLILITAIKKDFAKNCFTLGVLSAEFNTANLDFSWVYNIDDCYENFNSHHAGGRIKEFNGGYLLKPIIFIPVLSNICIPLFTSNKARS